MFFRYKVYYKFLVIDIVKVGDKVVFIRVSDINKI